MNEHLSIMRCENTLCVYWNENRCRLTEGILMNHGTKYLLDFTARTA